MNPPRTIASQRIAALAACVALAAACGGTTGVTSSGAGGSGGTDNPIVGTWVNTGSWGNGEVVYTWTFHADGTISESATLQEVGVTCSGGLQISATWSSTATMLTLAGTSCTGSASCTGDPSVLPCAAISVDAQTCPYTLSNGNDALTIHCGPVQGVTLTRQM